ncbi:unnamed protein product, partial [Effrenium voratum]
VNPPALLKPGRAAKCKAARTVPPPPTEGPAAKAAPSPAATKAAAKATAQSPPSEQTTPAAESTASAESTLGLDEIEVNSTNYKGQWMRLTRAARRPLDFPNIAQAFNGTAQDKRELLRKFLSAGENLQDLEDLPRFAEDVKQLQGLSKQLSGLFTKCSSISDDAGFQSALKTTQKMAWASHMRMR